MTGRAILAFAGFFLGCVAGSSAGAEVDMRRRDFWRFPPPTVVRGTAILLSVETSDPVAAGRRIAQWMEEHDGSPEDRDHSAIEMLTTRWTIPGERVSSLTEFLDSLSSTGEAPRGQPESSRVGSGSDAESLRYKRDELLAESEEMSGRLPGIPSVARLVAAYVASTEALLKDLDSAKDRTTVQITLRGGFGPQPAPKVPPLKESFPDGFSRENWDAVRYPVTAAPKSEERYLSWYPRFLPILELEAEHLVVIRVVDLDRGRDDLESLMKELSARTASFGPPRRREAVQWDGVDHQADVSVGFWVPREQTRELRKRLAGLGSILRWDESGERKSTVPDDAVAWQRALEAEIEGEEDHLAPYHAIRSLVLDQIRRLGAANETRTFVERRQLVSVRLARRL